MPVAVGDPQELGKIEDTELVAQEAARLRELLSTAHGSAAGNRFWDVSASSRAAGKLLW